MRPLQRGATKQRAGISAEVFGEFNKKKAFVPRVVPKSAETKAKLERRLLQSFMFSALDAEELRIVIDAAEERKVARGEQLILEGD